MKKITILKLALLGLETAVPVRHNLVAERIISRTDSRVSCGNWRCKEMIQGRRMTDHMAECKHRMVPCPYSACGRKMSFNSVNEHIKGHKSSTRNINTEVRITMKGYNNHARADWPPVVFKVQGQRFYLQCVLRNNIFMAWFMVEGGRKEATKWRATISVLSPKNDVICKSEVYPIDMTTKDVMDSGDCFVMIKKQLMKFCIVNKIPINLCLEKV